MMTERTLIDFVQLQYRQDIDFKEYVDSLLANMREWDSGISSFDSMVHSTGAIFAKYVLEAYELQKGKVPHMSH